MRWPLAKSTLIRLLSRRSASDDVADRQFADAIEKAPVRAEKMELPKEVNRDVRDRLSDLEAALGGSGKPRSPRGPGRLPDFA
jgi:hypothetical protein